MCTDGFGVGHKAVVRLAGYICDRPEAEVIADAPNQTCFHCFRKQEDNWKPGLRQEDGRRYAQDIVRDVEQAKKQGTWSERDGQPGRSGDPEKHGQFWCPETLKARPSCKVHLQECCDALRISPQTFHFNAFHELPFFDVYQQLFYESMHGGALGIWVHLLRAVLYSLKKHLQWWTDQQGKSIITAAQWDGVLNRIQSRLSSVGEHCKALSISPYLSEVGTRMDGQNDQPGKTSAGIRAGEQNILMLSFVYCLPGVIAPELDIINDYYHRQIGSREACLELRQKQADEAQAKLQQRRAQPRPRVRRAPVSCVSWEDSDDEDDTDDDASHCPGLSYPRCKESWLLELQRPEDPTDNLISILFEYAEINNEMRASRTDDERLESLTMRIQRWKELVLQHLPFKSGQISGWNFIKWHYLDHATEKIPWIGCLENASAQTAELCHQEYVKTLTTMINNHPGWDTGVLLRRARARLAILLSMNPGKRSHAILSLRGCHVSPGCSSMTTYFVKWALNILSGWWVTALTVPQLCRHCTPR